MGTGSNDRLANISIILQGTKHPGNLGSVARAMCNMGLVNLRLAAPKCHVNDESRRLAKAGETVLDNCKVFDDLKDAVCDLGFLVGSTGKLGGNRAHTFSPRALAGRIIDHAGVSSVGILFGPEDTGLVDDDLLLCQMLIRIPTSGPARSINLAQAVMIVCYEVFLAHLEKEPARVPRLASIEEVEAMYGQFEQALLDIGFLQQQNARHMMFALRRLLGRAGMEQTDVGMLRGIARQIAWFASKRKRGGRSRT